MSKLILNQIDEESKASIDANISINENIVRTLDGNWVEYNTPSSQNITFVACQDSTDYYPASIFYELESPEKVRMSLHCLRKSTELRLSNDGEIAKVFNISLSLVNPEHYVYLQRICETHSRGVNYVYFNGIRSYSSCFDTNATLEPDRYFLFSIRGEAVPEPEGETITLTIYDVVGREFEFVI
jgi:hypothetical protein